MKTQLLLYLFALLSFLPVFSQSEELLKIDLDEARILVDKLDKKFSKHYFDRDSVALYNMYAKGATFGTLKGEGKYLRY